MEYIIREKNEADNIWIDEELKSNWGSAVIISRRKKYESKVLDGIIAENNEQKLGICLYRIERNECEIVLFESLIERKGIGIALLNKLLEKCISKN